MNNWFLEYVEKGYSQDNLTYMYVGAVGNILDNEYKFSDKQQIQMLNELKKNYIKAVELVSV